MALVMPNGSPQPMTQGTFEAPIQGGQGGSPWDPYNAQIQQGYQSYLGRDASEDDLRLHHGGNPQGYNDPQLLQTALGNIRDSQEARNRQIPESVAQRDTPAPPPQATGTNTNVGGGGNQSHQQAAPAAPGVPNIYSQPQQQQQQLTTQYQPQQIRDFTGQQIQAPTYQSQLKAPEYQNQFQGQPQFQAPQYQSQLAPPSYVDTLFGQFNDPRNQQVQQSRDQQLINLLQNPSSLSQTWQDQMFETQKDDALALSQQMGLQNQQSLVGRGFNPLGNQAQAMQQDQQSQLMDNLLAGRRNIATQAATQNRADLLNALQAGEQGLTGDVNRAGSIFQNQLSGQQAQAQNNQFASQYGLQAQQAQAADRQFGANFDMQGRQFQSQFGLQNQQAMEQARQFAAQLGLQGAQAEEAARQFQSQFNLEGQKVSANNERDNYATYLSGRGLQGQENRAAEQFRQSAFGLNEQSRQANQNFGLQEWLARNNADLGWANYGLSADNQFLNYLSQQG